MLYLLGLSYGAVSLALESLGVPLSKTRVYEIVQATAARIPDLKREQVFQSVKTKALVLCSLSDDRIRKEANTETERREEMPKILRVRAAQDGQAERQVRKLAASRHGPADWIIHARMVALSWDGERVAAIGKRVAV